MTDRKLIAFDVDGTLTAYHGRLEEENRALLLRLSKKYRVLIVGAGDCARIFAQLGGLPLDILGNYGMEYAHGSEILRSDRVATDRAALLSAAEKLRARTGLTDFCGDSLFFHKTGDAPASRHGGRPRRPPFGRPDRRKTRRALPGSGGRLPRLFGVYLRLFFL